MGNFIWNFKGMNGAGADLAQQAAQQMQGYRPGPNMAGYVPSRMPDSVAAPVVPVQQYLGGEGAMQRSVGDRNTPNMYTPGAGANYALMEEYRANEAKIAELEAKIAEINKQWATGAAARNRASLDDLDRRLAVSRAKYGDLSGAYNHLTRIDSRALANKDGSDEKKAKISGIVSELENAYIMRNSEKEATAQAGWDNKIARLSKEYEELTGTPYQYQGATVDTGMLGAGESPVNFMQFNAKMSGMKGMRKDGRLTKSQVAELMRDVAVLPNGAEKDAIMTDLAKASYDNADDHDANVANYKGKVNKGLSQLMADWGNQKIRKDLKKPGDSTTRVKNGVTYTVTYTGTGASGKKQYEISANGKKMKTVEE